MTVRSLLSGFENERGGGVEGVDTAAKCIVEQINQRKEEKRLQMKDAERENDSPCNCVLLPY